MDSCKVITPEGTHELSLCMKPFNGVSGTQEMGALFGHKNVGTKIEVYVMLDTYGSLQYAKIYRAFQNWQVANLRECQMPRK